MRVLRSCQRLDELGRDRDRPIQPTILIAGLAGMGFPRGNRDDDARTADMIFAPIADALGAVVEHRQHQSVVMVPGYPVVAKSAPNHLRAV